MHIDTIPNRNSRPAYLLRESVREGKRVTKRTLANLSSLPLDQIEMIRRVLKGEKLGAVEAALEVTPLRPQPIAGTGKSSSLPGELRASPT